MGGGVVNGRKKRRGEEISYLWKYLQPPSLQFHAGTNCHTWRSDNPEHLYQGENKTATEATARGKDRKGLFGRIAPAWSIAVNLPGKMLFIHIAQGEVIPRGGPELAFYLPSQTEHKKAEPFLNHRLVTELGKQPLIGSAPLLQSAEECSLGEWRAARSTLPSRQLLPVSSGSYSSAANTYQHLKGCLVCWERRAI